MVLKKVLAAYSNMKFDFVWESEPYFTSMMAMDFLIQKGKSFCQYSAVYVPVQEENDSNGSYWFFTVLLRIYFFHAMLMLRTVRREFIT